MSHKADKEATKLIIEGKKGKLKPHKGSNSSRRDKWAQQHKTFLGNQKEGQGFADKRKKKVMHEYHKTLRKEKNNLQDWSKKLEQLYNEESQEKAEKSIPAKPRTSKDTNKAKVSKFHKAQIEWAKQKEAKDKRRLEMIHKQQERDESLAKYKQRKKEKHKKLCKRNYKGQPNMASQMEVLLKQIESQAKS